ncbi:MAG: class I SAM-dependent DNA methyltransferase [Candidatus Sumerlaeota bacterium]|nr:class I SAM-dependent DNA methyltransferase [Candidatus Sumerlaeota bacterium]
MPALSWNEIYQRAVLFSREWKGISDERAEAQTFWNEFFQVFGIRRRTVASFEEPVKSLKGAYHRIDLFWKGRLLAEHKSAGAALDKAQSQAFQYIQELAAANREDEIPRYVILSDFDRMVLFDLEPEEGDQKRVEFRLSELPAHTRDFAFFIGQKIHRFHEEDEANLKAAEIMAGIHDAVCEGKYDPHALERLLVRLLFCLFADDTGIFEPGQFELYLQNHTREDAADFGLQLNALFEMLNTPPDKRSQYLEEDLVAFPFINGELFEGTLPTAGFTKTMRSHLLAACHFDWSRISPAIFGSLFQGIMGAKERRQIGAHYTCERDILKLIGPLFLDDLRAEFERIRWDTSTRLMARLHEFQSKLARLKFLDPACGCGNFLVVAYRELRLLELDVLRTIYNKGFPSPLFASDEYAKLSQVDVHQFHGIEIGEWPARIAETALWITDHQMNQKLSELTCNLFQRIPLRASPHIRCANALRFDWNDLLPAKECSYVLGNPPFVGAKYQTPEQKSDMKHVAEKVENFGLLDYVTLWYFRAVEYIKGTDIRCAFVSTNSISQGEQVGVLWSELFRHGVKIHFAHQTFAWMSEAKGKAHVHVVIIGFGLKNIEGKRIFEYQVVDGEPSAISVANIAPYLVEGNDITITNRSKPLCDVPEIGIGNKPIDGGNYLFTDKEKKEFLKREPGARKLFHPWIGSEEFLHGYHRWCLWLGDIPKEDLAELPECRQRIKAVKQYRLDSKSAPTKKLAQHPRRFHVENFPKGRFLVIPEVSSEKRHWIPMGFLSAPAICSNLVKLIPHATLFHFGILTSEMHMAWVRHVCGRLESRYRYSAKLVYNNFPWPTWAKDNQRKKVEECAQRILDIREQFLAERWTLAGLYDYLCAPYQLVKAHWALNCAVDRCYRQHRFADDRARVEYLFQLYEQLTSPLAKTPSATPSTILRRMKRTSKQIGKPVGHELRIFHRSSSLEEDLFGFGDQQL